MSDTNQIPKKEIPKHRLVDYDNYRPISDKDLVDIPDVPKRNFWKNTPFGRTLSLRNPTGKTIVGIVLSAVGTVTGIKLDFIPKQTIDSMLVLIQNLSVESIISDPISLAVTISVVLITVFTAYLIRKGWLNKAAIDKIKNALNEVKKAKNENSPGGSLLTAEEKVQIQDKALDAIEEALKHHGINIDLNGDGK